MKKRLIANGEAAAAARGRGPERRIVVKPRRAVEWALYYPPLLDTRPERYPEPLRAALAAYRQNDLPAAFARLEALSPKDRMGRFFTLRAGLFLSVGRVEEAERDIAAALKANPKEGTALALRAVIAVVRNETEEALRFAQEAVTAEPRSSTPYVAFEIEPARKSLEEASRLAPEDALVWARLAEIELSLGDLDAALEATRKAEQLDPGLSRTQSVLGFAYLTRIEVDRAKTAFERALMLDPADPLPRLGLALARIREGDVDEGTQEIETAASLDPNNSLIRSYLGKAYFEQKRGGLASTEFEQAKLLDPKDPTPWFYSAIHKQTTNRPIEALHDLQHSIDLNDNRAVYRSRLLLDEDLAARGAALGRIYRDLGFQQIGLVEGWKSLSVDPADYAAHRLLADSYSALPRHEIARVSELLQSQLLQPINITPVQPQLAESDLFLLGGLGPADPSLNEFNSLFQRNRFSLLASGLVGSQETYGDEVVQSGIWNNLSYSLGQFHYETDGFRTNNDIDVDIYNAFVQARLTPKISVQAEIRRREVAHGNLDAFFEPSAFEMQRSRDFRREADSDSYRAGIHFQPNEASDLIASFIYQESDVELGRMGPVPTRSDAQAYIAETQYVMKHSIFDMVLGGGYYGLDLRIPTESPEDLVTDHGNAYIYTHIRYPRSVIWHVGLSADWFDNDELESSSSLNPKLGILWNITSRTLFRAGAFKVLKRSLIANQTLEPTQVAGFNQFFDDPNGTEAVRYGAGIDHRFSSSLSGGAEISKREVEVPVSGTPDPDDSEESLYRMYLNWAPHPRWAATLEYVKEDFDNLEPVGPRDTETQTLPISVSFFDPSGFFAKLQASYLNQEVALEADSDSDGAAFLDLGFGYRLPKRWGIFEVQVQNVLDQDYRFEGLQNRRPQPEVGVPSFLPFPPEVTVLARLTLALW
ncbi:MAG: TonB-dependent receptor [Pseudomonadota bacterium]|nr:TonB-dependent receptor [Pseudomonadota bacterium]